MGLAIDLFDTAKQVERAAALAARARVTFESETSPLESFRAVSGTKTLDALFEREPSALEAPMRDALARWVRALLFDRMSYAADRVLALARRKPIVVSPVVESTRVSWDEAWHELLLGSETIAQLWLQGLANEGAFIEGAARETRSRRAEVAERIETKIASQPGAFWEKTGAPLPPAELRALAEAILDRTEDLERERIKEARRGGAAEHAAAGIVAALAREATPTFPARAGARWLEDMFGPYLRGVSFAPPLPRAVAGAATFARALSAFGRAMRIALGTRELPFPLRVSPRSLDAERFGVLFGSLAAEPAFSKVMLGATPSRARADRRALGRTLLATARLRAARALVRDDGARIEELGARLFGAPLPRGLEGAWPLFRDDDDARLAACVEALPLARELVERFDEDWFRNPRAFDWMRARGAAPAMSFDVATYARDKGPAAAATELARHLEGLLG